MKSFVVGLTGPTGSGKSTVAGLFAAAGYTVLDCDAIARRVTQPGRPALTALAARFGDDILEMGVLNRKRLAQRAFSRPEETQALNDCVFPYITEEIQAQLAEAGPRALLDAPTLFEAGADRLCHTVVGVLADPAVRMERILARDRITEADARVRMSAGKPDDYYLTRCPHILYNNRDPAALSAAVHRLFLELEKEGGFPSDS